MSDESKVIDDLKEILRAFAEEIAEEEESESAENVREDIDKIPQQQR